MRKNKACICLGIRIFPDEICLVEKDNISPITILFLKNLCILIQLPQNKSVDVK